MKIPTNDPGAVAWLEEPDRRIGNGPAHCRPMYEIGDNSWQINRTCDPDSEYHDLRHRTCIWLAAVWSPDGHDFLVASPPEREPNRDYLIMMGYPDVEPVGPTPNLCLCRLCVSDVIQVNEPVSIFLRIEESATC